MASLSLYMSKSSPGCYIHLQRKMPFFYWSYFRKILVPFLAHLLLTISKKTVPSYYTILSLVAENWTRFVYT